MINKLQHSLTHNAFRGAHNELLLIRQNLSFTFPVTTLARLFFAIIFPSFEHRLLLLAKFQFLEIPEPRGIFQQVLIKPNEIGSDQLRNIQTYLFNQKKRKRNAIVAYLFYFN